MRTALIFGMLLVALVVPAAQAEEGPPADKLRDAIERGLAIVTKGAKNYPEHRQCFSCHHQTLPLMAMAVAREAGYKIDEEVFQAQVAFTQKFFTGRQESLRQGHRIGGAAATVSYGLWTYEIAKVTPDEVSDALVVNLLKMQEDDGRWRPPSVRPPLEESHLSCTVLSAYALQLYGRGDQQEAAEEALEKAGKWLVAAPLESTEDHAFALFWHTSLQRNDDRALEIGKKLVDLQREDGGWGQTADMESDAYATGQALFALMLSPEGASSPPCLKGLAYLLATQQDDGSWHVKTRSRPIQKFFDNGDPHGTDQFISMAATSWATTALALRAGVYSKYADGKSP